MTLSHPAEVAEAAVLACLLEVAAAKPGNVSRFHDLPALSLTDFLVSAPAIAPAMAAAGDQPVGATVRAAVTATRRRVATNTNLGIILLLTPLAAAALRHAPAGGSLRERLAGVLEGLTVEDTRATYQAIRLAAPGGMGRVDDQDVALEPSIDLRAAMALAAERDSVAREYVTGFTTTFEVGYPTLKDLLGRHEVQTATVGAAVELLARVPDSLIARQHGPDQAEQVRQRAVAALQAGGVDTENGRSAIATLDSWMRSLRPKVNPGTTADLITAALFVALLEGTLLPVGKTPSIILHPSR